MPRQRHVGAVGGAQLGIVSSALGIGNKAPPSPKAPKVGL